MHRTMDQQRNPFNEPYHDKAPRRSEAQITSDVCFAFADDMLKQQYGATYTSWLSVTCQKDRFTDVHKQNK